MKRKKFYDSLRDRYQRYGDSLFNNRLLYKGMIEDDIGCDHTENHLLQLFLLVNDRFLVFESIINDGYIKTANRMMEIIGNGDEMIDFIEKIIMISFMDMFLNN